MSDRFSGSGDDVQASYLWEVLPRIDKQGRRYLIAHGHRGERLEELLQEARAFAWEWWSRGGHYQENPRGVAWYAIRRANSGRRFAGRGRPGRCLEGEGSGARAMRERMVNFGLWCRSAIDNRADPAQLIIALLDVPAWFATLGPALQATARLLAENPDVRGKIIARVLGISQGRLSQRRRELLDDWNEFTN